MQSSTPLKTLSNDSPIFLLTAVRNETRIIDQFLKETYDVFKRTGLLSRLRLVIVDNASTDDTIDRIERCGSDLHGLSLEVVPLISDRGNQSAMAYGLRVLADRLASAVLTCDADGEDDLTRLPELVRMIEEDPQRLIFVYRTARFDALPRRLLYYVYKTLFWILTGQQLIPCNMMAIPGTMVSAIASSPLLALHFSYVALRLRLPYRPVPMARRPRYGGRSSQSVELLVHHALIGLTIFYEQVVARLLFGTAGIAILTSVVALAVLIIRIAYPGVLPDGFAAVVFMLFIGFAFVSFVLLVVFCLTCSIFRLLFEGNRDR